MFVYGLLGHTHCFPCVQQATTDLHQHPSFLSNPATITARSSWLEDRESLEVQIPRRDGCILSPNHMARDGDHVVLHPAIWAEGVDFVEAHMGFFEKRKKKVVGVSQFSSDCIDYHQL